MTYHTSLDKFFIDKEEREGFGDGKCGEDPGIIQVQFSRTVGFEVVSIRVCVTRNNLVCSRRTTLSKVWTSSLDLVEYLAYGWDGQLCPLVISWSKHSKLSTLSRYLDNINM